MKNIKLLKPFQLWTLQNFPFIEADFDVLTNYEMMCKIVEYLNNVIDNANKQNEVISDVVTLANNLKEYIDNYFESLDVQEEIDNKLDEMAESGQLTDIIAQYLDLAGVLAFDTISNMVSAENISNGSTCYTLGQTTYNDGKGSFYKIRTITSGDVVDGINIVALNISNTLIAEKIPSYRLNQLETKVNLMTNKKYIILGDSYANRENSWADRFRTVKGLNDSNSVIKKVSGTGFYATVDGKNFSTMVVDNIPFNANEVTDIIVCGGYNDKDVSDANLTTAFQTFVTTCKTNYPNATIYVGFIGWARPEIGTGEQYLNIIGGLSYTRNRYIQYCSNYTNVHYLNNVEYALHDISNIDDSYFHPTANGQAKLCELIKQAFETGSCNYNSQQRNITSSFVKETYIDSFIGTFYSAISNNESRLFTNGELYIDFDETTTFTMDNSLQLKIGSLIDGTVQGRGYHITNTTVDALINTKNNGYFILPITVYIDSGNIYLRLRLLNRTGNGWIADSLKYISIYGLDIKCNSMLQY